MECLDVGYFSRSTLKPLSKIFDLEKEKKLISAYINSGEWFMVSGVRRVGKTTLIRSLLKHLGVENIYINLWGVDEDKPFRDFIFRFSREVVSRVDSSLKTKFKRIEEFSILGLRVRIKHERREFYLDEILDKITRGGRLVVVIDEIQEMEKGIRNFVRFLSFLHDRLAPKVSLIILGSIASVRKLFEDKIAETEPLFGGIVREFNIKPFDRALASEFLKKGFEECKIEYSDLEVEKAIDNIGTITGWLVEFGREYTVEKKALNKVDIDNILQTLFNQAKKIVYGEIARALKGKRRFDVYLKILRLIASTPYISLSELSRALERRKPTVLQYIEYLKHRNIVNSENGYYNIVDPLYRRSILTPNFEREVKKRL